MRKFIISDIHGNGNIYNSIMGYLDNISNDYDVALYINGDLIDRGEDSALILLDVIKRSKNNNKFKIEYLGGNHEFMMYKFFKDRRNLKIWYHNGGLVTEEGLYRLLDNDEDKINDVVNYISNLNIYHKFNETINNKKIVLVHASCPLVVKNNCDLTIKDDDSLVFASVWSRELDSNNDYYSVIGHTPVNNKYGYEYNNNYINIDGGSSCYVSGYRGWDHIPLVEVCSNYLRILTFNNNNEIIYGNYFNGKDNCLINNRDLDIERDYLNKNVKIKKIGYDYKR